jgi:iron complex outermembrane receptor protein
MKVNSSIQSMKFVTIIGLCLTAFVAAAQQQDTLYLKEVAIYGVPITTYAAGSKIEKIRSGDEVSTLSDGLTGENSLYLKTYGNSQLSTIALRGTTASQTAVIWNGININSPTLGQTDFSLMPAFLFDEVSLHYGTASSLYGNDAIGGSVVMTQAPVEYKKTSTYILNQQAGSFGRWGTGLKGNYGNDRWQFRTKLFRSYIENDFPYTSPAVGSQKRQSHAAVENYGGDQQIHLRLSERQQLSAEVMYTYNRREIQAAVTNNDGNEILTDYNTRTSLTYQNDARFGMIKTTLAYVLNDQRYTDDETSKVRSDQYAAVVTLDKLIGKRLHWRSGINYNYYTAQSKNYGRKIDDNRLDAFLNFTYAVLPRWNVSANIRQSFYKQEHAALSPTLGTEVYLLDRTDQKIIIRAQAARGFRVPTLNDRYWIPGGNLDLQPEDAINTEGGVQWARTQGNFNIKCDATYYHSWLDQMIIWRQNTFWSPLNLQKVNIHGVEFSSKAEADLQTIKIILRGKYSYTRSINKEGLTTTDRTIVDKQLAYVPIHQANGFGSVIYKSWILDVGYNFIGKRYTTLDNAENLSLKYYGLLGASINKKFEFPSWSFTAKATAGNIMNVYYENLKNHAMPGRNYSLSLLIKI